nr:TPM domain-containing protein [Rhodoferax sp.]
MRWLSALLLVFGAWTAQAEDVLPIPALTGHVVDSAGALDASQRQALDSKLAAFESSNGSQIIVLLVPTTQPEDIASYANRVGNAWKIGRKGIGDGLLVVVAKNDHKLRIEVAKTLEGAIPDLAAKQIIDTAMAPRFKQNDYAGGLDAGVDSIIARVKGEALPVPPSAHSNSYGGDATQDFQWQHLSVFLFLGVIVGGAVAKRILGNKLGALATAGAVGIIVHLLTTSLLIAGAAGLFAMVMTLSSGLGGSVGGVSRGWTTTRSSGGGWSAGSGGRSSGGGFSSGGGGDFGGGGASGDW